VRRAIGANGVIVAAHVYENMRVVEGRQGTHAHKFFDAYPHLGNAWLVMEVRRVMCCHILTWLKQKRGAT
jgi:hypothetical protein